MVMSARPNGEPVAEVVLTEAIGGAGLGFDRRPTKAYGTAITVTNAMPAAPTARRFRRRRRMPCTRASSSPSGTTASAWVAIDARSSSSRFTPVRRHWPPDLFSPGG
jgi:hypothetical protein